NAVTSATIRNGGGRTSTLASPRISSARLLAFFAPLRAFAKKITGTSGQGDCVARALVKIFVFDGTSVACARTMASVERSKRLISSAKFLQARTRKPCFTSVDLKPLPLGTATKTVPAVSPGFSICDQRTTYFTADY